MENNNSEEKVIIKYSSYTEAQKRATQKYRQNNKDKVNEQRKKYYKERKEKDPEFLKYKREKAKEYYQKKKTTKDSDDSEDSDTLEQIKEEFLTAKPIELFIGEEIPAIKEDSYDSEDSDTLEQIKEQIKEDFMKAIDSFNIIESDNEYIETVEVKPKRKYNKKKQPIEPDNELPIITEEIEEILTAPKPIRKRKTNKVINV